MKRFCEWFDLSPNEIKKLKKETVFSEQSIRDVKELLYGSVNIIPYLSWCLLDEEMVLNFKNKLEDYFPENCDEEDNQAKERLDHLIEELLSGLRKDVQSESEEQGHSIQTRGEKRVHEVTEEESHSSSKRMAK